MDRSRLKFLPAALAALATLAACGGGSDVATPSVRETAQHADALSSRDDDEREHARRFNRKPAFVGSVKSTDYDGIADDLLTAGLGKSGLAGAAPPSADALKPTAAELRRLAIYTNYRALMDMTAAGGYGSLFGPNVEADGSITADEGKIAGTEVIAFSDDGSGRQNVTLMVQVPAAFDPKQPCIITATSSGSRSVYGAISTGEWGLKRGCAVAYNDKGTHTAPHDLANDTVPLIDGTRASAAEAGASAAFRAPISEAERVAFNAATPERFAFKHAHSQRNPEKDWGRFTLQAVEFAFWVLNERYAPQAKNGERLRSIRPENTLVIASSISNGGGAAIAAAELDRDGLIDGVAVSEPNVEMPADLPIRIERGGVPVPTVGKHLFEYVTQAQVYQGCAALAPSQATAPGRVLVVAAIATNRCASLKARGLVEGDTTADQAESALAHLRAYGWEAESAALHTSLSAFEVSAAVAVSYANALSRSSVLDNLCGYSFAAINANLQPAPLPAAALASMFATGNGVPPAAGVQLINNLSFGGPRRDLVSLSGAVPVQDGNLDGALCVRGLLTRTDATAVALRAGMDETRRSGNLRGKPALIVQGRDDALLPVNHTSRAYLALNRLVERQRSRLSYIEVTNAQHFDSFIGLPALLGGYDSRYVPLHLYLVRALDAMYAHLRDGSPLPPSQVVRTVPRGGVAGQAPAITEANVPSFVRRPAAGDRIEMVGRTLRVPE